MKVLHLVAGDLTGGAAKGALWLHEGLHLIGVESKVLTDSWTIGRYPDITSIADGKKGKLSCLLRRQIERMPLLIYQRQKKTIFSTGFNGYDFRKTELYRWADIIHLHWINGGFVDVKNLGRIDKPIVWTMRDMWPMTGGCHCSLECERYTEGCGYCEQLDSKFKYDLSSWVVTRKRKYLPRHMKLVGISDWLSNCARQSLIFKGYAIQTIYNNVNVRSFFPIDKKTARAVLGIKTDKKIILAGAEKLDDLWKGFDKYLNCLRKMDKDRYYLLFFGHVNDADIQNLGFEYRKMGYLHDIVSLRIVYAAADVFVAPTLMDAFGKTLAESMACGTPVVCFDATGPKEIVDHEKTGYKAKPYDSQDLAYGIEWVLDHPMYWKFCERARIKVEKEYDNIVIAKKYQQLYQEAKEGA
ncbi:MAG: glycosyltransferase [Deltaproteobacteria bacterium]|nr:MAG: glycosyltransferase [Deltaproteobacteria bacterium]